MLNYDLSRIEEDVTIYIYMHLRCIGMNWQVLVDSLNSYLN
jgi:hypothetical protein